MPPCSIARARPSGWRCRRSATIRGACARSASTSPRTRSPPISSAGIIAGLAGVLLVWFNGRISPGTIGVGQAIDVLVIAVIGGMRHPIGPFIGAVVRDPDPDLRHRYRRRRALQHADRARLSGDRVRLAGRPSGLVGQAQAALWPQESLRSRDDGGSGASRTNTIHTREDRMTCTSTTASGARRWRAGLAVAVAGAWPRTPSRSALLATFEGPFTVLGEDSMRGAVTGGRGGRRQGRRQEDRDHQGLVRRLAGQRRARRAQAGRAGRREGPGRAAVGRRRPRGQGLRQDPAGRDLRQRHLGGAGHDAARSGAEFLPLLDRRRAVDGRPRRLRLQRQGLQDASRPSPRTIRSPTRRCSASWPSSARPAATCRRSSGCRSATRTSPRSSPRSPTTSTRSMSRSAAPTASTS